MAWPYAIVYSEGDKEDVTYPADEPLQSIPPLSRKVGSKQQVSLPAP